MTEKSLSDVPPASSESVRNRMSRQAKRDTAPELRLRSALFAQGRRYRVNYPIPGVARRTIDIAFVGPKLAVFVDGCFWHGCPVHCVQPKTNPDWWGRKIARNKNRDIETDIILRDSGWRVVRIWEHERIEGAVQMIEMELRRSSAP